MASVDGNDLFPVRTINFLGRDVPTLGQNEFGPCALLGVVNALLLRGTLKISSDHGALTLQDVLARLADRLVEVNQGDNPDVRAALDGAVTRLPTLAEGLDVNVKFNGGFEFTSDLAIFDLLDVRLVHGWRVDGENDAATAEALGSRSYNECIQEVVQLLQSKDGDPRANAINAAEILEHEGARYGGVTNVELHALAASCDERLGRDTDARGHLERARDLLGSADEARYPQQVKAWAAVSSRLLQLETRAVQQRGDESRAGEAVRISKALTAMEKWEPTRWLGHAEVAKAVNDPVEAEEAYRAALDRDASLRRAYFGLCQVLEQSQDKGYKKRVRDVAKRAVKNDVWLRVNQRPSQFSPKLAAQQFWVAKRSSDALKDADDAGEADDVVHAPGALELDLCLLYTSPSPRDRG